MTGTELCERAGITYRQLDYWTRIGLYPDARRLRSLGSGHQRIFTAEQAAFIMRLARLDRAGINLRFAAVALHEQSVDGRLPDVLRIGDIEIRLVARAEPVPA